MAKTYTHFVCQQCGAHHTRWMGKCPACGSWDSLVEQVEQRGGGSSRTHSEHTSTPVLLQNIATSDLERLPVLGKEFAQVLGGGIVPGSVILIGGDPGIGKTTILTQIGSHFASTVGPALYVSAEESVQQMKLRAGRLGLAPEQLYVYSETNLYTILEHIKTLQPQLVIIDSIQTVYLDDISSAAGSVSQVRECALRLLRQAKEMNIPVFLVGHVTKEGAIAGPRVLEHIVDVVLYLEGERFNQYRLLRGVKNRFGSTNEVGVFEMTEQGMQEVQNPSQVFIAERNTGAPGSTIAVMLEGTRPLLLEVQALTSYTSNAQPRRTANGFDVNRLVMLVAVLSKRVGLPLYNQDIYVNMVGGLRVTEPAIDMAVALAIASSYRNQHIDPETVLIGEVGLSGELRSVSQLDRRLNEAARLGFRRALTPTTGHTTATSTRTAPDALERNAMRSLAEAVHLALTPNEPPKVTDEQDGQSE